MARNTREWTCPDCGATVTPSSPFQSEDAWAAEKDTHRRFDCDPTEASA